MLLMSFVVARLGYVGYRLMTQARASGRCPHPSAMTERAAAQPT